MEGVEADQEQGAGVQEEAKAVIHRVLTGQDGAGLELLEDELHPPPPLLIPGHRVVGPQLPDAAEAGEQLGAGRVTVEHRGGEERDEERGGPQQQEVEVGVGVREEGGLALTTAVIATLVITCGGY